MANYTANRGHNPKKVGAKRITANLANLAIIDRCESNRTDTIDAALLLLTIVVDKASTGNRSAAKLLTRVSIKLKTDK